MKIYTKTGDKGQTGLLGGPRVDKDGVRVETYGTVDELNAALGAVLALEPEAEIATMLEAVQPALFDLGGTLATPAGTEPRPEVLERLVALTGEFERRIDAWEEELEPLKNFVLPGGTPVAAGLHGARTVCRRAERRMVTLARTEGVAGELLAFVNRLSDLLFCAARRANAVAGRADVPWRP